MKSWNGSKEMTEIIKQKESEVDGFKQEPPHNRSSFLICRNQHRWSHCSCSALWIRHARSQWTCSFRSLHDWNLRRQCFSEEDEEGEEDCREDMAGLEGLEDVQ